MKRNDRALCSPSCDPTHVWLCFAERLLVILSHLLQAPLAMLADIVLGGLVDIRVAGDLVAENRTHVLGVYRIGAGLQADGSPLGSPFATHSRPLGDGRPQ
jgi:hypothetical protein